MKNDNKIVIEFKNSLFDRRSIMLAAEEYTEFCWILIDGSDDSTVVIIRPKKKGTNIEKIKDEFYNYVLATMKGI